MRHRRAHCRATRGAATANLLHPTGAAIAVAAFRFEPDLLEAHVAHIGKTQAGEHCGGVAGWCRRGQEDVAPGEHALLRLCFGVDRLLARRQQLIAIDVGPGVILGVGHQIVDFPRRSKNFVVLAIGQA